MSDLSLAADMAKWPPVGANRVNSNSSQFQTAVNQANVYGPYASNTALQNNVAQVDSYQPTFQGQAVNQQEVQTQQVVQQNAEIAQAAAQMKAELSETKKKQGFIGGLWDGFKNLTGIGAGSNKAENAIKKFENGEGSYEDAQKALGKYENGQKVVVDTVAGIASGLAVTACVVGGVFTGGATIPLAFAAGGAVNTAIKGIDAATGGREYSLKDGVGDFAMGGINGVLAVATAGVGTAVKSAIAPTANQYLLMPLGKQIATKIAVAAAGGAATGGVYGGVMGGAHYIIKEEGDKSVGGFVNAVVNGTATGAVTGAVIGGVAEGATIAKEGVTKTGMFSNDQSLGRTNAKLSEANTRKAELEAKGETLTKAEANELKNLNKTIDTLEAKSTKFTESVKKELDQIDTDLAKLRSEHAKLDTNVTETNTQKMIDAKEAQFKADERALQNRQGEIMSSGIEFKELQAKADATYAKAQADALAETQKATRITQLENELKDLNKLSTKDLAQIEDPVMQRQYAAEIQNEIKLKTAELEALKPTVTTEAPVTTEFNFGEMVAAKKDAMLGKLDKTWDTTKNVWDKTKPVIKESWDLGRQYSGLAEGSARGTKNGLPPLSYRELAIIGAVNGNNN